MTNNTGRVIFEPRYRNPNRYSKNAGMMSEHEDIDSDLDFLQPLESDCIDSDFIHPHESDFVDSDYVHPSSERSIVSSETGDDIEPYYSSDNSLKHQEITQVYDRTNSSDDDSVEISFSDDEDKDDGSNTSPTSSVSFSGREESIKVDNSNNIEEITIKKEKRGFFGKFFESLKSTPKSVEVPKKRNSELSDADIESALTSDKGYSSMESEFSVYEDSNHSQSESNSRSLSTDYASESETSAVSPMVSPRKSLHKERISTLPDVEEGAEGEEESVEEYRTYKRPMAKDPDQLSLDRNPPLEIEVSESEPESSSMQEIPPEQTPDPISPLLQKSKEASNTKSSKKKKKKKKKGHTSALSARNHAVSSRIDWAGQINSATKPSSKKIKAKSSKQSNKQSNKQLEAEVHRLRTLVELMMTRMTLYERQSECLVETSLQQDREWKMATIEHYEEAAKKRTEPSEVDKRLSSITNLVAERDIQDKWIRELECVQRGYEERLETTKNQLKELRYQHALTTKQIRDHNKNGGELTVSNHTPNTFPEDYNYMSEAKTPTMANGIAPIKRWLAPTNSGTTLSGTFTGTMTGTLSESDRQGPSATDISSFSSQSLDTPGTPLPKTSPGPGVKEYTSLLEEMIVAWDPDSEEISVLSEHGARRKPKKEKKKKKKKKRSSKEIQSENTNLKGGLLSN